MPLFKQPESAAFYLWDGDTLVLNILGRPQSKVDAIGQVIGHQLEVHVAAVPRRGGATAHMVRFLAGVFDVPVQAIHVVFGVKNVNKQIRITSPQKARCGDLRGAGKPQVVTGGAMASPSRHDWQNASPVACLWLTQP